MNELQNSEQNSAVCCCGCFCCCWVTLQSLGEWHTAKNRMLPDPMGHFGKKKKLALGIWMHVF